MKSKVFALGLDSVPPDLLEQWMAGGVMPRLAALRAGGAYGRIGKPEDQQHETSWPTFLQGHAPGSNREWGEQQTYNADTYRVELKPGHATEIPPPFYAPFMDAPSVIFDVPYASVLPSLPGVQLLGWGLEKNLFKCESQPRDLWTDVVRRHGMHAFVGGGAERVLADDGNGKVVGFRLPSVYDPEAMQALEGKLIDATARRAAILAELMAGTPWSFTLAATSELHLAMHMFWNEPKRLARIARAFDDSLEPILRAVPAGTRLMLFSVSGMSANYADLTTMLFLPEFLYRLQFGEAALADGGTGKTAPPPAAHYRRHWKDEVWALRTARGERDLESPEEQGRRNDPFDWSPLNWYQPQWPRMKAFALPGFSHGMVRINLCGRDREGMVDPADYGRCCDEIAEAVRGLRNARSGRPIARAVNRTRTSPHEAGEDTLAADLMITWDPDESTEVVESPLVGRIGPVPWMRTGGHAAEGFCIMGGPGIAPGGSLRAEAGVPDLTATLLDMLDIARAEHIKGRSLV